MSAPRRWPLFLIAAPAAVAVWSGWVGLGGLCGFGLVQPLPGIVAWHLNTAITLPVGVEAYGAYALGAWLTPGTPGPARTFARRSAIGALCLGMLGQVVYHLLAAAHRTRAPWPVVVLVACLPVVTLGFGAALTHLLRVRPDTPAQPVPAVPVAASEPPEPEQSAPDSDDDADPLTVWLTTGNVPVPGVPEPPAELNGHGHRAAELFAADITAGNVPGIRRIRSTMHVGQPKAQQVQAYLNTLSEASGAPEASGAGHR